MYELIGGSEVECEVRGVREFCMVEWCYEIGGKTKRWGLKYSKKRLTGVKVNKDQLLALFL